MNGLQKLLVILLGTAAIVATAVFFLQPEIQQVQNEITVPDPAVNSLRMNGLIEVDVYETAAIYESRYYEIICTIAPMGRFHVGERDVMFPGWRHVWSEDGTCNGWAWLP